MAPSSADLDAMVFQPAVKPDLGKTAMDGLSLSLLMQFDGKKTLGQVARAVSQPLPAIHPVVSRLLNAGLIRQVTPDAVEKAVDQEFMAYLVSQLSIAIGPLGRIIVEDGLEILGRTGTTLPVRQAAELVNLLSREIPREEKRNRFKQDILRKMQEKNYL